ncbi:hypothetical protein VM1G_11912 [Cytospora mali]|uniref:Uncharacterized protein n=1 Tax=Cytospora mali TaxID=578113 RepID=A0A194WAG6_CYTMA|nr:hypothetical protein VM1G_11912 [Valsa mali]
MPAKKTVRVTTGAEMTEAERADPNAAWEATVTKGMKETENEMILQGFPEETLVARYTMVKKDATGGKGA